MTRKTNVDKLNELFTKGSGGSDFQRYLNSDVVLTVFEVTDSTRNYELKNANTCVLALLSGEGMLSIAQLEFREFKLQHCALIPNHESFEIKFPNASVQNPCFFLVMSVEPQAIERVLSYFKPFESQPIDNWLLRKMPNVANKSIKMNSCVDRMLYSLMNESDTGSRKVQFRLKELILRILQTEVQETLKSMYQNPKNDPRLKSVTQEIQQNYTRNFSIDELADMMHLSKSQFFRVFKNELGLSPTQYINNVRILHAQELLTKTSSNITEISMLSGFSDIYYFSRCFKEWVGITPTQYRSECREPMN